MDLAIIIILGLSLVVSLINLITVLVVHGRNLQRWEQTKQRGKYYDWDLEKLKEQGV